MPRRPRHGQPSLFGEPPPRGVVAAEVPERLREVARALPGGIRLGTSSWSFPGWDGIVYGGAYSKDRLARRGLGPYARHPLLRAVGVDRTYYAPIPARAFAEYAAVVPGDFRFLVKAHEACTVARYPRMARYGTTAGARNELFLDAGYASGEVVGPFVEGLGERAGALLFQFPPLALDELGGAAGFVERLHGFLSRLPAGPRYAIELRNAEVFGADYLEAVRSAGAVHCLNVHPSMPPVAEQARAAELGENGPLVVRWMLHSGLSYERARERYRPFDRLVDEDPAARAAIAALCQRAAGSGRPALVIANNKAEGSAPLTVFELAREIVGA